MTGITQIDFVMPSSLTDEIMMACFELERATGKPPRKIHIGRSRWGAWNAVKVAAFIYSPANPDLLGNSEETFNGIRVGYSLLPGICVE